MCFILKLWKKIQVFVDWKKEKFIYLQTTSYQSTYPVLPAPIWWTSPEYPPWIDFLVKSTKKVFNIFSGKLNWLLFLPWTLWQTFVLFHHLFFFFSFLHSHNRHSPKAFGQAFYLQSKIYPWSSQSLVDQDVQVQTAAFRKVREFKRSKIERILFDLDWIIQIINEVKNIVSVTCFHCQALSAKQFEN